MFVVDCGYKWPIVEKTGFIMNGFYGNHPLIVDDKSRMKLPAKFRVVFEAQYPDELTEIVVTLSLNGVIAVFPRSEYDKYLQELTNESQRELHTRKLLTAIEGCTSFEKIDKQNRVRLDPTLCRLAGITKDIYVIGRKTHMEIWDRKKWEEFLESTIPDISSTADMSYRSTKM